MACLRAHLNNAPITEAVIDFRVHPNDALSIPQLSVAASNFEPSYVKQGPIFQVQATIAMSPERTF
jgi:hypothetical protein